MMLHKIIVISIGFFLVSPALFAHSLHIFAQYDGNIVSGKAYYSDMTPAKETYLAIFQNDDSQQPTLEGKTDNEGMFHYPLANGKKVKVVVEGEEGHRAMTIATPILTKCGNQNDLEVIRADIATLKDKIYLHDILGGIGYIFGIIGCFALWRSYRIKTPIMKNKE